MQKFVLFCERYGIALIPICLILLGCGLWPEMELLVPSLPDMKRVFDVQDAQIQQLLTANFIGFLIGVLLAGPLCDSKGRRLILVVGAVGYLLSSFLCCLVTNFPLLMLARFVQGLTMTGPVIAGGVLLMEATSGLKQIFWMTLANTAITFCMAFAPIVGSWINTGFGYKGNLWSILILGIVGIIPALIFVSESLPVEKRKPLKASNLFKGYYSLLKNWRFMCFAVPMCALAAAYWVYVGISALYMVNYLGIPQEFFGRYQGPIVGTFSVVSLCSSKLLQRFGLMNCIRGGLLISAIGGLSLFGMNLLSHHHAVLTTVFMMLFVGGMAPICGLLYPYALGHLPAELQGNAAAMIQALRLFFASVGTGVVGFVYKGPLLPVTVILLFALAGSALLLWYGREFLEEEVPENSAMAAAH